MTYTVKNGTWCKDNEKEYYSTTKTGLKAALKAGEITSGTHVVVHKPKYHAGQLIQSLNPECPEGCFVPHGQSFDTTVYEELAKIFTDGKLPDLRECVLVCAGQNEHITTHEHDVFSAGEFKDDCAAAGGHTHTITINDPGHGHSVSDPGHGHSVSDPGHGHSVSDPGHGHTVTDPGHGHSVSDPGHDHGRGTYDITGKIEYLGDVFNDQAIASGAFKKEQGYSSNKYTQQNPASSSSGAFSFTASNSWTGRSENVGTGVSVNNGTTGVSISSGTTGVSISSGTTGVSISSGTTGVSVGSNTTGITAECSSAGASGANVTRTKQYGVYYYIAF